MNFEELIRDIGWNLNQAMEKAKNGENYTINIVSSQRFYDMCIEDITKLGNKIDKGFEDAMINKHDAEESGKYTKNYDFQGNISESSWMSTRAGALGEVFGEAPRLSQCCQQEIVNNEYCSHCGKKCKEMPTEGSLNEEINKIKKLF